MEATALKTEPTAADRATQPTTPPLIGEQWEGQGGIYAGLVRGEGDIPQHHVVLLNAEPDKRMTWQGALDWAASIGAELPTRSEGALLYANLRESFDGSDWYWLATQYSGSYAWSQYFGSGGQGSLRKSYEGRARAVRRLFL